MVMFLVSRFDLFGIRLWSWSSLCGREITLERGCSVFAVEYCCQISQDQQVIIVLIYAGNIFARENTGILGNTKLPKILTGEDFRTASDISNWLKHLL